MRRPSAASAPRSLMRCGGASRHGDTPRARSPSCAARSSGCSAACTTANSHPAGGPAPSLRAGCTSCIGRFSKRGAEKVVLGHDQHTGGGSRLGHLDTPIGCSA